MLSHITVGTDDFDRDMAFYTGFCAELGLVQKFTETLEGRRWAGWKSPDRARPLFILTEPFKGDFTPGNGQMIAFTAESRAHVDRLHARALTLGAQDEGAPGLRPAYHDDYYGAYLRDPAGNKLCVVCHDPVG